MELEQASRLILHVQISVCILYTLGPVKGASGIYIHGYINLGKLGKLATIYQGIHKFLQYSNVYVCFSRPVILHTSSVRSL